MSRRYKKNKKQIRIIISSFVCFLLVMTAGYAAFSTNISLSAKGNIKDPSRVIQSWTSTDTTDFHSEFYKQNIVTATFLDTNIVPSNATESWDVSEDGKGGVMAYVTINETETTSESTKYDLFIGAEDGVIANENSKQMFYNFTGLSSITFNNNFDTSTATNMQDMFANCRELIELDLSSFDTRNVTNMANMFVSGLAANPMKIERIIFGENFVTTNVTNISAMFGNCSSLTELDVSNFDTQNVTYMLDVFSGCTSLTKIDVSNFVTNKVTTMRGMFFNCLNLTELDLSSFDTSNVIDMGVMFAHTKNLKTIYVSDKFVTTNVTTYGSMFYNSTSLVGGNGTPYNSSYVDKTYARIDTAETPGYFTLKTN